MSCIGGLHTVFLRRGASHNDSAATKFFHNLCADLIFVAPKVFYSKDIHFLYACLFDQVFHRIQCICLCRNNLVDLIRHIACPPLSVLLCLFFIQIYITSVSGLFLPYQFTTLWIISPHKKEPPCGDSLSYYLFCILLYFLLLLFNQFTNSLKIFGCQLLTVKISSDELYCRTTKTGLLIILF